MSTDFLTKEPMSLEGFRAAARTLGWSDARNSEGGYAMRDGHGHYCHHIDDVECSDGQTRVTFTRAGRNDNVYDLAEALGCWTEHDDEFSELVTGSSKFITISFD
jgi:hypothetical protein